MKPDTASRYISRHNIPVRYSRDGLTLDKMIGPGSQTFVVAEAACNHMCSMELAKKMVDSASSAGADAIKFQTYRAEELVTHDAIAFWGNKQISQIEYYRKLDRFGKNEYDELFAYACKKGVIPFSSPFDDASSDMLAELDMPIFKIASCDINNLHHLRHIADFGKPIILSTGASTLEEIDRAIETIYARGNDKLMLLACTLSYPTKVEDANFGRITTLSGKYPEMIIGVSDHTEPDAHMIIPSIAVALGAKIVEKHYTLDRSMTGSGHFFAVDPQSLKKMVHNIRLTETVMGSGKIEVSQAEQKAWASARRSIVAKKEIKKGTFISPAMLAYKRPSHGISPDKSDELVGKCAAVTIPENTIIQWDMIDSAAIRKQPEKAKQPS